MSSILRPVVIYHKADFDGIFCSNIAHKFLPDARQIGWDYGDPIPFVPDSVDLYMLDISVEGLMEHPRLIWIDHHKSAIEKYPREISGYRLDGVAACRLTWKWFAGGHSDPRVLSRRMLPDKEDYIKRMVNEPWAVRLAGEYDIWDKRDPDAELFQHGLRSRELTEGHWSLLLDEDLEESFEFVAELLEAGKLVRFAKDKENESIIRSYGFTVEFEGLKFLACNHARFNSHLFTAGIKPEHEGLLGFVWTGSDWKVSLYGVPGKPDIDFSKIAVKYGGGGHRQACGFRTPTLPFLKGSPC